MSGSVRRRRKSFGSATGGIYEGLGGPIGGGLGSAWRSLLRPYPYTRPQLANGTQAIDAYGRGTIIDTTWNLTGQTGTVWTCTTQAHMTTAVASANPGDIIKIAADITAPVGTWILGERGPGTIYIVTDYEYNRVFGGGTAFERRPSVSDWSTLSLSEWAAEITACRARKSDTYRILSGAVASTPDVSRSPGIFSLNASAPTTRWVLGCLGMRPDPTHALTVNDAELISIRDNVFASLSTMAGNVWFSRCKLFAGPTQNFHVGIEANGSEIAMTDSIICEIHSVNYSEPQAFSQQVGRGTKVINCTLDGCGMHFIFGGNPISSVSIQAQDIEIRACHMITPNGMLYSDATHSTSAWAGKNYLQKQPWESKFSKRGWMEGCILDGARPNNASFGYALSLISLPQYDGNNCETSNWAVRQMRFRNTQGVLNVGASGYLYPAPGNVEANRTDFRRCPPAQRLHFLDTLVTEGYATQFPIIQHQEGYDTEFFGFTADGVWQKVLGDTGLVVTAGTLTIRGLAAPYGSYGVTGGAGGTGKAAFDYSRNGLTDWQHNTLYGSAVGDAPSQYTGSCATTLLASRSLVGFVDPSTDQWDVVGANATETCNATLVRALTDAVVVETYAP